MHVDVHLCRVDIDVKHATGELFGRHIRGIRLLQRRHCGLAFDKTPIDKKVLVVAVGFKVIGAPDKAPNGNAVVVAVHLDQTRGKFLAEYGVNSVLQVSVTCGLEFKVAVNNEAERDFGIGKRDLFDVCGHCHRLGDVLFEELATRGNVGKEIFNDDRRTCGASLLPNGRDIAAVGFEHRSKLRICGFGDDANVRDRCNGGKRLTAEAECEDAVKVLCHLNFTRGVAANGYGKILGCHAAAVVGDAHKSHTTVLNFNSDAIRSRVNRVLHQLLDDRCRTVYNLSRRY